MVPNIYNATVMPTIDSNKYKDMGAWKIAAVKYSDTTPIISPHF